MSGTLALSSAVLRGVKKTWRPGGKRDVKGGEAS